MQNNIFEDANDRLIYLVAVGSPSMSLVESISRFISASGALMQLLFSVDLASGAGRVKIIRSYDVQRPCIAHAGRSLQTEPR